MRGRVVGRAVAEGGTGEGRMVAVGKEDEADTAAVATMAAVMAEVGDLAAGPRAAA